MKYKKYSLNDRIDYYSNQFKNSKNTKDSLRKGEFSIGYHNGVYGEVNKSLMKFPAYRKGFNAGEKARKYLFDKKF